MPRNGESTINAGSISKTVADVTVAANSLIGVICTTDPGEVAGGAVAEYISKSVGVGFTVYFSSPVENYTTFDYGINTPRRGTGTILEGSSTAIVADVGVGAGSLVAVSLNSGPAKTAGGSKIEWIEKSAGVGFTLHMTSPVQDTTTFDYSIPPRTGNGTIPAGVMQYYVAEPTVAADSLVLVSLTSNTGDIAGGAVPEVVYKVPGYGFTIELLTATENAASFDYFVA